MDFHLNLTIRGLCAFLPMDPFVYGEQQTLSRMRVLVLDARTPRRITERTKVPIDICAHTPELRLPGETLPLSSHRIVIEGIDNEFPLLVEPSFGRMAQMDRVAPNAGSIQERWLTPEPAAGLVANLDLTSGIMEALAPRREELFFQPNLGEEEEALPYHGHFTSMVHVQMRARDEVIILGHRVRDGESFERRLRPRPTDDAVDVVLINSCSPLAHHEDHDQESDFAAFYDLSTWAGLLSIPRALPVPGPDPERGPERGTVLGEASVSPACIQGGFSGPPRP